MEGFGLEILKLLLAVLFGGASWPIVTHVLRWLQGKQKLDQDGQDYIDLRHRRWIETLEQKIVHLDKAEEIATERYNEQKVINARLIAEREQCYQDREELIQENAALRQEIQLLREQRKGP